MTLWKRWSSGFVASIDNVISQVENHEAQVASALRELERGVLRSKVQLQRVERDGVALRQSLGQEREAAKRWRERAKREEDEKRALECLRRCKRSETRSLELDRQLLEHERVEHQLASDVRTLEQRVVELRQQRNTMRTRQSRAEAMTIVYGQGELCGSEITEIFERWELRVSENEVLGGCVRVPVDTLDEELTSAEEEASLRLELKELKVSSESSVEEDGR
jgi:phage shock protein A